MTLKPVAMCRDPFFVGRSKLILCEVLDKNGKPAKGELGFYRFLCRFNDSLFHFRQLPRRLRESGGEDQTFGSVVRLRTRIHVVFASYWETIRMARRWCHSPSARSLNCFLILIRLHSKCVSAFQVHTIALWEMETCSDEMWSRSICSLVSSPVCVSEGSTPRSCRRR